MGQSKKSNQKGKKPYSVSSIFYINKGDKTSHWVENYKLKELDINDLSERKQIIEDMEAEMTEAPKKTSNTENLAVAEEKNVDEAVTAESKASNKMEIYPKKERNKKAYKIQ